MSKKKLTFIKFDSKEFAKAVVAFRYEKQITIRAMAKEAGVSENSLYRMEVGETTPDIEKALRVAAFIGKKIDSFIK